MRSCEADSFSWARLDNILSRDSRTNVGTLTDVSFDRGVSGRVFRVTVTITLPGVDHATAQQLAEAAHQVCPYSNATRGNVDVRLHVTV